MVAGVLFGTGEMPMSNNEEEKRSRLARAFASLRRRMRGEDQKPEECFKLFPEPPPSQRSKMRVGFTRMAVAAAGGIDRVESCAALLAVARRIREGTHSPKPTPPSEEAETGEPHSAFAAKTQRPLVDRREGVYRQEFVAAMQPSSWLYPNGGGRRNWLDRNR
jgi:hypothetical protein